MRSKVNMVDDGDDERLCSKRAGSGGRGRYCGSGGVNSDTAKNSPSCVAS